MAAEWVTLKPVLEDCAKEKGSRAREGRKNSGGVRQSWNGS